MVRFVNPATLAVVAFIAATASAEIPWETVTSKDGQFTVQMPEKPTINQTRNKKGADGNVKTVLIGCTTNAGAYFAYKVILPTSILKGTEDAELDAERDDMAKEWKGKVIAEKKIRAGDMVGRDFTIRGKPDKGVSTLTIRVREYLSGNAVYLVAVISAPNRELPDDSGRFLGSLEIGKDRVRAQGTRSVEPKGKSIPGWDLVAIDPDKDCEITDLKKSLRLTVPGTRHDLVGTAGRMNAPRLLRIVQGDFVITVKVAGDFRPGGPSTNPKGIPFNGAGILIWSDIDNFIRLERAAVARGQNISPYVNFEEFEGGTRGATHNEKMQGGDCWLRMERKGSQLFAAISFDNVNWRRHPPIQTVWPTTLKVGVTAISSSSTPFTVTFEEFELKAAGK